MPIIEEPERPSWSDDYLTAEERYAAQVEDAERRIKEELREKRVRDGWGHNWSGHDPELRRQAAAEAVRQSRDNLYARAWRSGFWWGISLTAAFAVVLWGASAIVRGTLW